MMSKPLLTISLLLLSSFSLMPPAEAQTQHSLNIAVGEPGSGSFILGTEIWAMGEISLRTQHDIGLATVQISNNNGRMDALGAAEVDIALVSGDVPVTEEGHGRTVMVLWPSDGAGDQANLPQILARDDVPDELIYQLTKGIFNHTQLFKASSERFDLVTPARAITGAVLPIHPGAARYYEEAGVRLDTIADGLIAKADEPPTQSAVSFTNFDDTALNQKERDQVAAACRQALDLGALSAVLGDLSTTGCEVYQTYLEDQTRAREQEAVAESEYSAAPQNGQGGPAITLDGLDDPAPVTLLPAQTKAAPRQPTM